MELPDSVEIQAKLSMRHLKRILQVYNIDINHIAQLVCYISSAKYFEIVKKIWFEEIKDSSLDFQGILNCVVMPKLPKNAKVEWQAIGKKHAFKKYDQFALNTSYFWGSTRSNITPVMQLHEIFVAKIMNKLIYFYYC